jgi:ABC-type Fe3+ transport system permease subunit
MGKKLTADFLFWVVFVSFIFFIALPVIFTIGKAILNFDVVDYDGIFNNELLLLLLNSVLISICAATLSTVIGTLFGFLIYKTNIPFTNFFKLIFLIPLVISPYILAVALNDFFLLFFSNTQIIRSPAGVVTVFTVIYTPLAMLITGTAFSGIDAKLEEAGLIVTEFKNVFLKIIIPLIKPALISSFVLIFIFSISEFSVPSFLNVDVIITEIFTEFSAFYNYSTAIVQSFLLVVISVFLLFSEGKYLSDAPFLSVGGTGMNRKIYKVKNLLILPLILWLFLSVAAPFAILILQSFKNGTTDFLNALILLKPTFSNSILLAVTGAFLAIVIGFTVAFFQSARHKIIFSKYFDFLLLIIFAIPSVVYGISLIYYYNNSLLSFIYSSYAIIIIGYAGKFSFISSRLIGNSLKQIPVSFEEAATLQGIKPLKRFIKITIPLTLPSIFIAFVISFIFSIAETGTTIMVYPPGTEIMPVKVFTIMANAPQALTSAMTLIVFSVTLLLITVFYLFINPLMKKYNYASC